MAPLLFMCWVTLVLLPVSLGASCQVSIPTTGVNADCDTYDISMLAAMGPITYKSDSNHSYVFNLCENVPEASVPDPCKNAVPSVAYQYTNSSCYSLGQQNSSYVFPLDPSNSTLGVRLVYAYGDGGTAAPYYRAVIYDLVCASEESTHQVIQEDLQMTLVEFPTYTYVVRIESPFNCVIARKPGTCPTPVYNSTWGSIRFRPRPGWYDRAKFGIFIHWGIFSVPSFKSEWYWKYLETGNKDIVNFHNRVYGCSGVQPDTFPCTGPPFKYADFAPMFKAELFDPDQWADLFKKSGAQYVVLTSKHHEGWCNFPSAYHWNWNSIDTGPMRDLVGDLTKSVRAAGLHMGLYHSLREWYNPLYEEDVANDCSNPKFPDEILLPTLKEIVELYQPEVIWADGAGDSPCTQDSVKYWKAPEFLSWVYNESPVKDTVVANSRWGSGAIGDYQTGGDRYSPGHLVPYKWESCYTIQQSSWGYDRTEDISGFLNTTQLIYQLVSTVSCNGNLLLNVGPTADGRILPAFEQRLLEIGDWLRVNGPVIFDSKPWTIQFDTDDKQTWYTQAKHSNIVYAITFKPQTPGSTFVLSRVKPLNTTSTKVFLLGWSDTQSVNYNYEGNGFHIYIPDVTNGMLEHAWTYALYNVVTV